MLVIINPRRFVSLKKEVRNSRGDRKEVPRSVEDVILDLQKNLDEISKDNKIAKSEVTTWGGELYIRCYREETDREKKTRIAHEKHNRESRRKYQESKKRLKEENEIELLRKLQKKYGKDV